MLRLFRSLFSSNPFLEKRPTKFISWYKAPYRDVRHYLCPDPQDGYYYSDDRSSAKLFDSFEEAKAVTPKQDGSPGIENRTGVLEIYV